MEVRNKKDGYVIIDCGTNPQSIKISADSLFEGGTMEDTWYKVSSIDDINDSDGKKYFSIKTEDNTVFNFYWIDKKRGLARWEIFYSGSDNPMVRYYVFKDKQGKYKRIKGDKNDCITDEDFLEPQAKDNSRWIGTYKFYETIERREHLDTFQYIFNVNADNVDIKTFRGLNLLSSTKENYRVSNDSLIIHYTQDEEEFIIVQDNNEYLINGSSIYMLNPPNREYPLKKIN